MAGPVTSVDSARHEAACRILLVTDEFGFDCHAAGWLYDRQTKSWRFLLSTPMLRSRGPSWIYERLVKVFHHHPLPPGMTPLDIYVMDPTIELAVFGAPLVAIDDATMPPGLQAFVTSNLTDSDFFIRDGFVAFYRRLPMALRQGRRDASRRFDTRVQRLEAA